MNTYELSEETIAKAAQAADILTEVAVKEATKGRQGVNKDELYLKVFPVLLSGVIKWGAK